MVKIKDITRYLEEFAPLDHQESYDNSGLLTGDENWSVNGILITLDCTEAVVEEAIDTKCNLIIAHHPILFRPIKSLIGSTYLERTLIKAIKADIAIYAIHTNLDNVRNGVNKKLAEILGLTNLKILAPKSANLMKLVTFSPKENTQKVLTALHLAGAGSVGNYDDCAYITDGTGTFKPNDQANPHLGTANQLEQVSEDRIEVILPRHLKNQVLSSLFQAHPYEEVAYYLQELDNLNQDVGSGMIGQFDQPKSPTEFLRYLQSKVGTPCIKHTQLSQKEIQKVAICGGSGSFLIKNAVKAKCDAFITADLKYHEFFDGDDKILLVDIGHYESEVATKDLLGDIINEKFSKFAVRLSKTDTNPIRYF